MKLLSNIKFYINRAIDYLLLLYAKIAIVRYVWKELIRICFDDYYMIFKMYIDIDGLYNDEIMIKRGNTGLMDYPNIWTVYFEKDESKRKEIEKKYGVKFLGISVISKKTSMKTLKEDIIDFLYMLKELNDKN